MTKEEFIEKRGIEAWEHHLKVCKEYRLKNKEKRKEWNRNWQINNNDTMKELRKKCSHKRREMGKSQYCEENYDLIENYEQAKADNFKDWHLHHRLEKYWSRNKLKKKLLYYKVNPEALIWLPEKEHKYDSSISFSHPELSKWHQRSLERE